MNKKVLPEILTKILEKIEIYVHSYDRKVFINGMSALITQPDLSEIISIKALQIIDSIVTMLKIQQMSELKERERKKNLDIESDDEEEPHTKTPFKMGKMSNQEFYDEDDEDNEDIDEDDFNEDEEDDEFDEEGIDFSKENEEVIYK